MRILGIDPGLNTTGYGVIEVSGGDVLLLEGGVIRTDSADAPLEIRLSRLYDGVTQVLAQFSPQALAIEELYSHYERPTTAILMGHARGVICLAAAQCGVRVFSYASTEIKSALAGNGRASKEQMQRAIEARLRLKEPPSPHDVADALAVAICHHQRVSSPIMAAVGELRKTSVTSTL
ncbi:MAG: crossover junction endodeoxyribonuclease RuvC [Dehalococcoidia bacterium]|nr:Crossover junction endodeoxyribonuclease RuvC [Chloroflexota bacterium]MBT9161224.1 Crossover junction endodeoxyribonuclease RuvC [Chloroflexota bacterium]MBT9163047.1 Crossover junction endodeoxyribonuclease RuvC [Chloroflexota bacterium]